MCIDKFVWVIIPYILQAANYDPNAASDSGTCTYLYEDPETGKKTEGELREFVTTTLGSLFGNKSDRTGPNWEGTGYAYSGDKVSQRDIERLVSMPQPVFPQSSCPAAKRLCVYGSCQVCASQAGAVFVHEVHAICAFSKNMMCLCVLQLRYENVVKQTLDKAEADAAK